MPERVWQSLQHGLSCAMDSEDYKLWIGPLKAQGAGAGRLVLSCPNSLHRRQVQERFLPQMKSLLDQSDNPLEIVLGLDSDQAPKKGAAPSAAPYAAPSAAPNAAPSAPAAPVKPRQMSLPGPDFGRPLLNQRFLFANFVSGGGNELAFAAARAMAQGRRIFSDTLFLTSGTGLGKSHLIQAVGHQVLSANPAARVAYLTAEEFTNQMVGALRHKRIEQFKDRFRRDCDLLLLEEVQFLSGKDKTQDELAFTLDALLDAGKRVIFTSPTPANQVKGLKPALESRISSGVTVPIDPPDFKTRVRILSRMAAEEGLQVEMEVLEYLAQEITSDVRRLQSALVGLMAKGSLSGRPMDLNLAAEVLGQISVRLKRITPVQIRDSVARAYGMEVAVLTGKGRAKTVTRPRNLAMTICRRHTEASFAEIGRVFNRDHATVMYGVNKIERDLSRDPKLVQELSYLEQRLGVDKE